MRFVETALRAQDLLAFYVVQPLVILMLGIFIGKVLEQVVIFLGREFAPKRTRTHVLAVVLGWSVYIGSFLLALQSIGVLGVTLTIAGSVVAVVLGAHLLLSLRDFLSNYRHFRAVQRKVEEGTAIETEYGVGMVVSVLLADTHLKLKNGDDLYIPNKTMRGLKVTVVKKA